MLLYLLIPFEFPVTPGNQLLFWRWYICAIVGRTPFMTIDGADPSEEMDLVWEAVGHL
jgi:hypothetical protein